VGCAIDYGSRDPINEKRDEDCREAELHIGDAHDDGIEETTKITADKSKHDADQGCQEDARSSDHQRHAGAEQNG
jgi:hypothetical protein